MARLIAIRCRNAVPHVSLDIVLNSAKTSVETSVSLPLEVGATALEVTAKASQFVISAVHGFMPASRAIVGSIVILGYGMAYSDEPEEQIMERVGRASILSILEGIEAWAIKTGQWLVKDWDKDEKQ